MSNTIKILLIQCSKFFLFMAIVFVVSLSSNYSEAQSEIQPHIDKQNQKALEQHGQFVTYYYQNPQSDKLIPSLQYALNHGVTKLRFYANFGMVQFYAAAIRNSSKKNQIIQELQKLQQQYSGSNQIIIKNIIAKTKNFISPEANSPENFDLLWSEFFATGKDTPVKKIANFLKLTNDKDGMKIIFLAAAEWSLASNAVQHPKVATILRELYPTSKGIMKIRLKKILDNPTAVEKVLDYVSHPHNGQLLPFKEYKELVWIPRYTL